MRMMRYFPVRSNQLKVMWKDHHVGTLTRLVEGGYQFTYNVEECQSIEEFDRLIGFPELDEVYTHDRMFACFERRIPEHKRTSLQNWIKLKYHTLIDPKVLDWEFLKQTGGKLATDQISFKELEEV